MVRFVIVGVVIAVAFTLYTLVDAAMTDSSRARGLTKPVWVVLIVVLPVVGGILWLTIGRGPAHAARPQAPDDDPRFSGNRMSNEALDAHMRDLEDQLRALDEETYPGEGEVEAEVEKPEGGDDSGEPGDSGESGEPRPRSE